MYKLLILLTCLLASLICSAEESEFLPQSTQNLLVASHQVNHSRYKQSENQEAKQMRLNTVAVSSYSWGMQEGAFYRSAEIKKLLSTYASVLNKGIDFNQFVIDGEILLPQVSEAKGIYVKISDTKSRSVNKSLRFTKSAKSISQAPSWRDYLTRSMPKPQRPINQEHPKNNDEIIIWDAEFKKGWLRGVEQADAVFMNDLNRMRSDIAGLYQFRYLLAQNVVTLPTVTKNKKSVMLLDSGRTINLNDVTNTITVDSSFKVIDDWEPVILQGAAHE